MDRVLPPIVPILFCIICCQQAGSTEQRSSAGSRPPTTLDVRLIDENRKPVEGARVGVFADFGYVPLDPKQSKEPADESGWRFIPGVVSDRGGLAHIAYKNGIRRIVARHAGRQLVAIQAVAPDQAKKTVAVVMHPQCKIFGRLTAKELERTKSASPGVTSICPPTIDQRWSANSVSPRNWLSFISTSPRVLTNSLHTAGRPSTFVRR